MRTGISDDLREMDDTRKTAIIDRELTRLNISIAALQETRLAASGSLKEENYTFFWKGKEPEEPRQHGVGFAIKNTLLDSVEPPSGGTERLLSIRLGTAAGPVHILSAYAPTLAAPDEAKDQFYGQLDELISGCPKDEALFLLGDLNARTGADHESWPNSLGHHGTGKINANGQRLLELSTYHDLCITNTFFECKPQHKVSWKHPRSHRWHQLDLIITRRSTLNSVLLTRSYHSADCDTDHTLVCSKVRLQPRRLHRSKPKGRPRINTAQMSLPHKVEEYVSTLEQALQDLPTQDATSKWSAIKEATYNTAMSTFGKKVRPSKDWFNACLPRMEPAIEAKREAFLAHKRHPSPSTLTTLRSARSTTQRLARQCANEYWQHLCEDIHHSAVCGNTRSMYNGIKKALGPLVKGIAPLKSLTGEKITDRESQMTRWVEHYSELYSRETLVSDAALSGTKELPIMEDLDEAPSMEELSTAIKALPVEKAPGSDNIPPEAIKHGKPALLQPLHELLCLCWEEGGVPQDMRDASIVTIYKNKGDRSDCNNYRGISLLSIVGKVYARVLLNRLQLLADRVYPESQCGFRTGRSTTDMIFSLRQLQEKSREQGQPLYTMFIDLTKAFDLVSRKGLFELLKRIGCPPKLRSMLISFHTDMKGTVLFDGSSSDTFPISSGVKQGCVLAPTLFGIFFSLLLTYAFESSTDGVYLHTRSDGKLLNLARLRSRTKVRTVLIREMLFADDAALVSHTEDALQRLADRFADACKQFGLTISLKKTNISVQDVTTPPTITIDGTTIEAVENFTYLGSTISNTLSLDVELDRRLGKANTIMARLTKRVWENKVLTEHTKSSVYQACVLSTLLYGSETWTTYMRQERRLNSFHMRCLKRILGISWQDRIPHRDILERAKVPSIYSLLSQRRLRWLGHVRRMEDGRLPKDILYGQLTQGTRRTGRPQLRFKDVCKRDMMACSITTTNWEIQAMDRDTWRHTVHTGITEADMRRGQLMEERRERRKRTAATPATQASQFLCTNCSKDCHSRIGLHSHNRRCQPPNNS